MSSSRSIAAARNRRAGDSTMGKQPAPPSRPGTSIGANAAFNQPPGQARKYVNAPQPPMPPQQQFDAPQPAKISISDAIGLTTLRLGRVEQAIQRLEQTGVTGGVIPENSHIVDQSVLHSIVGRVDTLEKKDIQNTQISNDVQFLKNELFIIKRQVGEFSSRLEHALQDIYTRFSDIDQAFVEIENSNPNSNSVESKSNESITEDAVNSTTDNECENVVVEETAN